MNDLTLVVMAAGMGSRFGGLKQIEPIGPNGEIIADYSVYDAINAGFTKVVFIIRKENLDYFKEHITSKFQDKIKVEFAFQELEYIPSDVKLPDDRVKMLGTGHAILCAKNNIDGDFAIINADDFYGSNAFKIIASFLKSAENREYSASANYKYIDTASKIGKVKRGVIKEDENHNVTSIIESEIGIEDGKIIAQKLQDNESFEIEEGTLVSMNFIGLRKNFLNYLESEFDKFIHSNIGLKDEFLIPEVINKGIHENVIKMKSLDSNSKWMGVTYKEDLEEVKENINKLIERGEYPSSLW